ncbi:MAG: aminopeptidase [Rhodocyclales bacterium]|nr:aminopeptidase [Rhodocyclales bacterium]
MNRFRNSLLPLLLALAMALTGCGNIAYYAQAVGGHFELMRAAQPISELVARPAGDPQLGRQLAEVAAIRDFASRELGLPDNNSYRSYADLGRPYVVWNVFAAPELSLAAKQWCVLLVGCVNYRGYYGQKDAERLAAELRAEGYDTFVGGVAAYSTLGYFDDPVLNTFMRRGTLEVARIVFHELAHQLVYVKDDTAFNESFATVVEDEGMRRWTAAQATPAQSAAFAAQRLRRADFTRLLQDYRERARELYASGGAAEAQRRAKGELFAALRRDYAAMKAGWGGHAGYDRIIGADFNNAGLVAFGLYSELVPAFAALLAAEQHDLPRFYRRVGALAALAKDARRCALAGLLPPAAAGAAARDCPAIPGQPGADRW